MTVVADEAIATAPCHRASLGRYLPVHGKVALIPEMLPEIAARLSDEFGQPVICSIVNGQLGARTDPPVDFAKFCHTARRVLDGYLAEYEEIML